MVNSKKNYIYYIAMFLLVIKIFYSTTELFEIPDLLSKVITVTIILLMILKILLEKYTLKQIVFMGVIGIATVYSSYITKDYNILLTFLMIVGIKNVDIKKVLKIIFIINITMILIHIAIYFIMLNTGAVLENRYVRNSEIRHSLLLGHPNYSSLIMLSTYEIFIYLTYERKNFTVQYIAGIMLAFFIEATTQSRTTLILVIATIIITFISRNIIKKHFGNNIIKKIAKYIFCILAIAFMVYLLKVPGYSKTEQQMDQVLSGRIWNMKYSKSTKGITVIGQYIDSKKDKIILDNIYAKLISNYGIFYLIVLSYLFIKYNSKLTKKEYIFIIVFAINGLTEHLIANTCISIPLIILADTIFNRENKDERRISEYNSTHI